MDTWSLLSTTTAELRVLLFEVLTLTDVVFIIPAWHREGGTTGTSSTMSGVDPEFRINPTSSAEIRRGYCAASSSLANRSQYPNGSADIREIRLQQKTRKRAIAKALHLEGHADFTPVDLAYYQHFLCFCWKLMRFGKFRLANTNTELLA